MADSPSPAPAPTDPPAPDDSSGQTPSDYNQAQLETVGKSEGIARTAKKTEYYQTLIDEGMEAGAPATGDTPAILPTPDALLAECANWRELSRKAVVATDEKEKTTGMGTNAATALRREVEFYRGKARLAINKNRQWKEPEVESFKARYFINKDIFTSRDLAEQSAGAIIIHATEDKLPGVTPARLKTSAEVLEAYKSPEDDQTDAQSKATDLRTQRDTAYTELLRLRQEIQLTADTAWPWHDDQNLAIRREFLLPAGRAFTG